jgi:hypothetical protein
LPRSSDTIGDLFGGEAPPDQLDAAPADVAAGIDHTTVAEHLTSRSAHLPRLPRT